MRGRGSHSTDFVQVRKLANIIERRFFETLLQILWSFKNRWVHVNICISFIRTWPEVRTKSRKTCWIHESIDWATFSWVNLSCWGVWWMVCLSGILSHCRKLLVVSWLPEFNMADVWPEVHHYFSLEGKSEKVHCVPAHFWMRPSTSDYANLTLTNVIWYQNYLMNYKDW